MAPCCGLFYLGCLVSNPLPAWPVLCIGLSPQWFCDILFVACCCDKGLRGGLSLGRASVVSTIALCEGLSTLLMCFLAGLIRWAERLCSSAGVAGGGGRRLSISPVLWGSLGPNPGSKGLPSRCRYVHCSRALLVVCTCLLVTTHGLCVRGGFASMFPQGWLFNCCHVVVHAGLHGSLQRFRWRCSLTMWTIVLRRGPRAARPTGRPCNYR